MQIVYNGLSIDTSLLIKRISDRTWKMPYYLQHLVFIIKPLLNRIQKYSTIIWLNNTFKIGNSLSSFIPVIGICWNYKMDKAVSKFSELLQVAKVNVLSSVTEKEIMQHKIVFNDHEYLICEMNLQTMIDQLKEETNPIIDNIYPLFGCSSLFPDGKDKPQWTIYFKKLMKLQQNN